MFKIWPHGKPPKNRRADAVFLFIPLRWVAKSATFAGYFLPCARCGADKLNEILTVDFGKTIALRVSPRSA
jgi:hypothetical protein